MGEESVTRGIEPGSGQRVLIVDDNIDGALLLGELLSLRGYAVRTAPDGEVAIALLEEAPAEAVLLDIGLPGADGFEVAKAIRALELDPRPLVVALTGSVQEQDKRRARAAGFDDYLTKPVTLLALEQVLSRIIA